MGVLIRLVPFLSIRAMAHFRFSRAKRVLPLLLLPGLLACRAFVTAPTWPSAPTRRESLALGLGLGLAPASAWADGAAAAKIRECEKEVGQGAPEIRGVVLGLSHIDPNRSTNLRSELYPDLNHAPREAKEILGDLSSSAAVPLAMTPAQAGRN